ncbi:aminoglycoside phosphotransferase family protein [Dactylosporangium sp. NPDC051541]|uniref:aminoglycoside phosphotransferase family protein n=1 Tax=Dactylosporangium sp. NPDC051541 TaxID=3363977 RepID=UPI00378B6206
MDADIEVSVDVVRNLVRGQHADLDGPLRLVANGWDNAIFRLGSDLAVRVPRRRIAAALIEHEQRWLPELGPVLPIAIPAPVRIGRPSAEYPYPWTITAWIDGTVVTRVPVGERGVFAEQLAGFLNSLHRPAPVDAPVNPVRGVALVARSEVMGERFRKLGERFQPMGERFEMVTGRFDEVGGRFEGVGERFDGVGERFDGVGQRFEEVAERGASGRIAQELSELWNDLAAVSPWAGPPQWVHGDLHAANLLTGADGFLAAVLDFGDLTAGDPATDLAAGWLVFDAPARARFRAALDVDEDTWQRGRGWALCMAAAIAVDVTGTPEMYAMAAHALREIR